MDDNDIAISDEPVIENLQPAELDLDALLAKYPAEEKKEEETKEEEVKDESAESKEESKETEKTEDDKEDPKDKEAKDLEEAEKEIEGYYADEALEDEEVAEAANQSPQEELAKYIYDGLQSINVVGVSNGKSVNLNLKVADELPDDFEFASIKDQARFNQAIASQAITARNLADRYLAQQQQVENTRYAAQERRDIATDIAALQRAGELPTFTPGTSVEEDPRAETAREVLKFYEDENAKRLTAANGNQRLYHHLSYEDAYYRWKQRQGTVSTAQKAEDTERKEITKRASKAGRGTEATAERKRVNLPYGTDLDRVIDEALKIY